MELACELGIRRACLHARWIPRLQNEEADALTNGDFRHFSAANRIHVDLGKLGFVIMDDLFREGESYVAELDALKQAEAASKLKDPEHHATKKRKKGPGLRETDAW